MIMDLFSIVAKFSLTLTGHPWNEDETGTHPMFEDLQNTYDLFRKYATFLYTGKRFSKMFGHSVMVLGTLKIK